MNKSAIMIMVVLMISTAYALVPTEDESGNGFSITPMNGIVYNNTGEYYTADGVNDYMNTSFNRNFSQMTITFAWKKTDLDSRTQVSAGLYALRNATRRITQAWVSTNSSAAAWGKSESDSYNKSNVLNYLVTTAQFKNQTNWVTVSYVYNNTALGLYKNGVYVEKVNFPSGLLAYSNATVLQLFADVSATRYLKGDIDNLSIYNIALNASDVLAVAQGSVLSTVPSRLVAYFTFSNHTVSTDECIYSGTGDFNITDTYCNITNNYNIGKNLFMIKNSTVIINGSITNYSIHKVYESSTVRKKT